MKIFGIVLVVAGIIWAVIAFNMQTTVTSPPQRFGSGDYAIEAPSVTVNNIGLMDRRRNNLLFAGLTILVGAVFVGFGSMSKKVPAEGSDLVACPYCAEPVKAEAVVCKHCGRDIGAQLEARRMLASHAGSGGIEGQRDPVAGADREKLRELCTCLRERALTYDEYQQLAKAAGASLMTDMGRSSAEYVVTRAEGNVSFTRFKALRPWFLQNVVPKIESDA